MKNWITKGDMAILGHDVKDVEDVQDIQETGCTGGTAERTECTGGAGCTAGGTGCTVWISWQTASMTTSPKKSGSHVMRSHPVHRGWGSLCQCKKTESQSVTPSTITKVISHMKSTQCSLDHVPSNVLGQCLDILLDFMVLVNESLNTGVLPKLFKGAVFFPLIKEIPLTRRSSRSRQLYITLNLKMWRRFSVGLPTATRCRNCSGACSPRHSTCPWQKEDRSDRFARSQWRYRQCRPGVSTNICEKQTWFWGGHWGASARRR